MKTEIQDQFKTYLESKGYQLTTVKAYSDDLQEFIEWTTKEKLSVNAVQYKHLLELIKHVRRKGRSKRNANKMLRGVDLYYRHLIEEGKATENPANGLRVKGATRRIPHDLVEMEDLVKMYQSYPSGALKMQRNKTILSLIVHQALSAEELKRLEPGHIKLKQGKMYVPGAQRSNSRTLNLEAHQIIELQEYLHNTRPRLLEALKKVKHRKVTQQVSNLFFGMEGRDRINQITGNVVRKLKAIYPQYSKLTTNKIRESVIAHWLKTKDVRIAQYMAGHRYASSTERYQETNLEDLKELLTKHHPLENEALA
jgi:integrase/recombinase XerD